MLRALLDEHGRSLALAGALGAWSAAALLFFVLGSSDTTTLLVPLLLLGVLAVTPLASGARLPVAIVGAGYFLGLGLLEAGIRWSTFGADAVLRPSRYTFDWIPMRSVGGPLGLYTLQPRYEGLLHGKPVRINSLGYRGQEIAPAHPDAIRVMAFGSSITLGEGMGQEEAYPDFAARLLSERTGLRVQGVNCGVPAFGLAQTLATARAMVGAYQPDVAILEARVEGGTIVGGRGVLPDISPASSVVGRMSFARKALAIIPDHGRAVWARAERMLAHRAEGPPAPAELPPLDLLEQGVTELAQGSGGAMRVLVFLVTPLGEPRHAALAAGVEDRLEVLARRTGALIVDSSQVLHDGEMPDDFLIFPGDPHPNARAHARFAERIAAALAQQPPFLLARKQ